MNIAGFTKVEESLVKPRLLINVAGEEKSGKSHFALTAPGPIAYFDFDHRADTAISKMRELKDIYHRKFRVTHSTKEDAAQVWESFEKAWYKCLDSPDLRSIVIDTGTDIWEVLRLAKFGKLTQVMPHKYTEVNSVFGEMFKAANGSDKNVIVVHKLKPEYVNDRKTGNMELSGQKNIPYLVEINVIARFQVEDGEKFFSIEVDSDGHNPVNKGEILYGDEADFVQLATMSLPDVPMEDWF